MTKTSPSPLKSVDFNASAKKAMEMAFDINGLRFEDKSRRVLLSWGALPQMLERGTAEITLHLPHPMKIRPLELDGTVSQKELPAEFSNGKLRFHIATDFLPGGTLASLLIREKNKATGR